jgi:hypothetical protein
MSDDQQNTELTWEQQQQAERDAETRRAARIQADEHQKFMDEKKAKRLSAMSQSEFRQHITEKYGYDPG